MSTVTGTKTITATSAAVFAGSSALANRAFLYVRNLDDCIAITINGRIVEPGEEVKFKLKASVATVIYGQSTGRAVQALVQEVA